MPLRIIKPPLASSFNKKTSLTNETKLKIVKRKEAGKGNITIGEELGLPKSTMRIVWKNKEAFAFEKTTRLYGVSQLDNKNYVKNPSMVLMEQYCHGT